MAEQLSCRLRSTLVAWASDEVDVTIRPSERNLITFDIEPDRCPGRRMSPVSEPVSGKSHPHKKVRTSDLGYRSLEVFGVLVLDTIKPSYFYSSGYQLTGYWGSSDRTISTKECPVRDVVS